MGCAKNEADSAKMASQLEASGLRVIDNPQAADAVIVNTCSFIQSATEESIEAILDAADLPKVQAGQAVLIVSGCMPARYGESLSDELSEVNSFVACSEEDNIASVVTQTLKQAGIEPSLNLASLSQDSSAEGVTGATFAYVKISEGCNRWCSYCTIPLIRGRYYSFSEENIFENVKQQAQSGVREIVLIGQDTGIWGLDFDTPSSLAQLIDHLATAFPQTWFRAMYIQPEGITDELLDVISKHNNVCSYLDIPLQHVDSEILKNMNRRGSREKFVELINHIKQKLPNITLRTTLIAGFPGETEAQFEDLLDFVNEGHFDYVGVFPYSREDGTKAAEMPGQIDEDEKLYRAQQLRNAADAVCSANISARIGSRVSVLVEGSEEDGQLFGRTMQQAPEVDGVTYIDFGAIGEVVETTICDTLLYDMEGE
jgi:ribosomal protein S12 methylthiotransferase